MSPKLRPANITLLAVLGVVVVVCSTSVDLPFVSDYDYGLPHHRSARSVSHDNIPTADVQVDNVTFYFHKMGIYENVTCLSPGSKIHFRLAVHFPVGTTDMVIELFTPDNETTLMTVCDVHVTWTGTALTMSGSDVPEMDAKVNGSTLYDRAILSLGNVTNSGGGSVAYDSMLYVEWDVIMVDINDTNLNGSVEWASAGAEYDQESMIFVAQASICLIIDDWNDQKTSRKQHETKAGKAQSSSSQILTSNGSRKNSMKKWQELLGVRPRIIHN